MWRSKIKANASKHKAMSYDRMSAAEQQWEAEILALLEPVVGRVEVYVPPDRLRHRAASPAPPPPARIQSAAAAQMRDKLATPAGRGIYALRKTIVEPVFGQIKEIRGFRRFYNLLKLFRGAPQAA